MASSYPHVSVISVYENYLDEQSALLFDDRECVYVDDDHLTSYGAKLATPQIEQAVVDATAR